MKFSTLLQFPKTVNIAPSPYRPYIVPTLYGVAYFFLILNIFALGYYRNSAPFHTVGLTLSIFGLVAMIQTNGIMKGIDCELLEIEPGEENTKSRMRIALTSQLKDSHFNLMVQADKKFAALSPVWLEQLSLHAIVDLPLRCRARGVYPLTRIRVASRGLFGLFFTWTWLPIDGDFVIYPRREGHLPLPIDAGERAGTEISGEDFSGHRPYQVGMSPRSIDWKAYARGRPLLSKEFERKGLGNVHFRFDRTPGADTEARLRQLAAWAFLCLEEHRGFSLEMPGESLSSGHGLDHLKQALRLLAAYEEPQ